MCYKNKNLAVQQAFFLPNSCHLLTVHCFNFSFILCEALVEVGAVLEWNYINKGITYFTRRDTKG